MGLLDHDTYIIERKRLAWNNTSIIRDVEGNEIGRALNRETKQGEVTLYDSNKSVIGKLIGTGFYNRNGRHVATVKKKPTFKRSYWVKDPKGNNLYDIQGNFKDTEFTVQDMKGNRVAIIRKRMFSMGRFTIKIKKINPLIPILFVLRITILTPKDPYLIQKI